MDRTRRGQQPQQVGGLNDTFAGDGTMNGAGPSPALANGEDEFRLLVATRIRPFTRKEVRDWRAEQRQNLLARQQQAVMARGQQRQPFGPGTDALADALDNNKAGQRAGAASPLAVGAGGVLASDDDQPTEPEPVMDVENDGTTVVLLDPQNPGTARGIYTYDYVFSSFAPSVDIMDMLANDDDDRGAHNSNNNGLDGTWAEMGKLVTPNGGGNNVPLAFDDEVDLSPDQEEQAEAEQRRIFAALGLPLIDAAFQGLNVCIFAYGQTSSGKTYTMLGSKKHRGIMPRLCHELFRRIESGEFGAQPSPSSPPPAPPLSAHQKQPQNSARGNRSARGGANSASNLKVRIEVSYMEIYNEQVRDLLKQRPKNAILHYNSRFDKREIDHQEYQTLKVRHHPTNGIYVEGLTTVAVHSWKECSDLLRAGSQLRTQCSTEMNENSSRSHAIFQLAVTQTEDTGGKVRGKTVASTRVSKVNLVDLAGSERNASSQATGKHLAEANSINVSLSTLRRVIDGLVSRKKGQVIPYRESLLTYVLSDNFGGNSRTVMCANVSPSAANVAETESTLRYATMARAVRNRVKVNENPQARVIRELKDRMRTLQAELANAPSKEQVEELELGIQQGEAVLLEMQARELALQRDLHAREAQEAHLRQALTDTTRQGEQWRQEAARAKKEREQLRVLLQRLASSKPELLDTSVGEDLLAATASDNGGLVLDGDDPSSRVGAVGEPSSDSAKPPAAKRKRMSSVVAARNRGRGAGGPRASDAEGRRRSSATSTANQPYASSSPKAKKKKKQKKLATNAMTGSGGTSHGGANLDGSRDGYGDDGTAQLAAAAAATPPPPHLSSAYRQGQPPLSPSGRRISASEPPSGRIPGLSDKLQARLSPRTKNKAGAGKRLPPLDGAAAGGGDAGGNSTNDSGIADSRPTSVEELLAHGGSPLPSGRHDGGAAVDANGGAEAEADRAAGWERQLAGLKANRLKKGTPLSLLGGLHSSAAATGMPTPASAPSKIDQTLFSPLDGQKVPHPHPQQQPQQPARANSSLTRVPNTYDAHVLLTRAPFSGVEDDNDLLWSGDMARVVTENGPGGARQSSADRDSMRIRVSENEISLASGSAPPPCFATTRVRLSTEVPPFHTLGVGSDQLHESHSLISPNGGSRGGVGVGVGVADDEGGDGEDRGNASTSYQTESFLRGQPDSAGDDLSPGASSAAWDDPRSPSARAVDVRRASVLPIHDGDPELSITGTATGAPAPAPATRSSIASSTLVPHPPPGSAGARRRSSGSRGSSAAVMAAAAAAAARRPHRSSDPKTVAKPPPLTEATLEPDASAAPKTHTDEEIMLSPNNGETTTSETGADSRGGESPQESKPTTGRQKKSNGKTSTTAGAGGAGKKAKKKKAVAENDVQ